MGQKLPPDQLDLYNALDKILWEEWDPIGVNGVKEARDEYQGYLPTVFSLALKGAPSKEIAQYLHWVITERMGLSCKIESQMPFADKIRKTAQEKLKALK